MDPETAVKMETVWLEEGAVQDSEPTWEQNVLESAAIPMTSLWWKVKEESDRDCREDKSQLVLKAEIDIEEHSIDPGDYVEEDSKAACSSFQFELPMCLVQQSEQKHYDGEICGKSVIMSSNCEIQQHTRSLEESKAHKCQECNKSFNRRFDLVRHLKIHTRVKYIRFSKESKSYICKECDKCFNRQFLLVRHLKTHTGDKPFECTECNKYFKSKLGLRYHLMSHRGDKPFRCKQCDNCFLNTSSLRNHLKTHTLEKLFKCNECSKCFRNNGNLSVHLRTHTGDKPFKCKQCDRSFTTSSGLKCHVVTHTLEKPLKCIILHPSRY